MEFPKYRKLINDHSYYLVDSDLSFIEFKLLGTRYIKMQFQVKNYYDKLLMSDILEAKFPYQESNLDDFIDKKLIKKKSPKAL